MPEREWFGEMHIDTSAQADMIERLRACVAAWLAGKTPQEAAAVYDAMARHETRDAMRQQMAQGAKALRALQPGDLGLYE